MQGNIVNGTYIAGLIFIAQQSLNSSQGFIESLDYANGIMVVNGTKVQINDPLGRFSIGKSPDVRFSIDEDNPTVRAETAFPMCIPRQDPSVADDPLCPQKNRPKNGSAYLMKFTMDPRGVMPSPASPTPTDPTVFAPFEVGDYVTYAGTLMDGNGGRYISAHTVIANVGIFTTPGDVPAYVAIDVVLQGAPGIPNPAFPQEATAKVRVEGFSTDPSRPVDIFAIDQDCNGVVKERSPNWAFEFTVEPGPPTIGKKGRFRFLPAGGSFLPPSRNVGVKIDYPAPAVFNQTLGIVAGRYQAPNFTFIFPENLAVGDPPVPLNFSDLTFLVNGSGPWGGYSNQPIGSAQSVAGRQRAQRDVQQQRWRHTSATGSHSHCKLYGRSHAHRSRHCSDLERGRKYAFKRAVYVDADHESRRSSGFTGNTFIMTTSFTAPTVASNTNLTFQVSVGGSKFHYSGHGNGYCAQLRRLRLRRRLQSAQARCLQTPWPVGRKSH